MTIWLFGEDPQMSASVSNLKFFALAGVDCEVKGHWFDSQSGHMPELQARSPVDGMKEATD